MPEFVRAPRKAISRPGRRIAGSDALAAGCKPQPRPRSRTICCAILYTSGTTGKPKGCMHTHRTDDVHGASAARSGRVSAPTPSRWHTAPFFHVTGMQHSMNAPIYAGATIVMLPRWDPEAAGYMIERYGCTHWANVPTMVVDLLAHPATAGRDLSSLRNIFGGGAAMPEAVAQKLFERCGIEYMEAYGMTETISQTHMNPAAATLRKQCLGIPDLRHRIAGDRPRNAGAARPERTGRDRVARSAGLFKATGTTRRPRRRRSSTSTASNSCAPATSATTTKTATSTSPIG